MKPRTEELLYLLLWSVESLARPTFRNLTGSFEAWAYRNGLLRQLERLEQRKLIEKRAGSSPDAIYRLSESGRLTALGGRDPEEQWRRRWDGTWRLVLFDLPETKSTVRVKLRRFLKSHGFGYLQNSVWISPDPLTPVTSELAAYTDDVESLITLEAKAAAGESDSAIVSGAWDFPGINRRYERSLEVLRQLPEMSTHGQPQAPVLRKWAEREREAWWGAISTDPLLPERLLPPNYLGRKAWRERVRVLSAARRLIDADNMSRTKHIAGTVA